MASNFGLERWRSKRKRGTCAHNWWPHPWQPHRRSLDKLVRVTAVWLKCRGTWHKTARCITPARVDFKRSGQSGHGGRTNNALSSSGGEDLFTAKRYPGAREHESPRRHESRRRSHRRQGALHQRSCAVHCTIIILIRVPDRAICRAQISNFYVATC